MEKGARKAGALPRTQQQQQPKGPDVRRRSPFPVGTLVEVNACDEKPVWVEAKVSELLLRAGLQMKFDQISFINEATLQICGDFEDHPGSDDFNISFTRHYLANASNDQIEKHEL
jgi:hypothetical protein